MHHPCLYFNLNVPHKNLACFILREVLAHQVCPKWILNSLFCLLQISTSCLVTTYTWDFHIFLTVSISQMTLDVKSSVQLASGTIVTVGTRKRIPIIFVGDHQTSARQPVRQCAPHTCLIPNCCFWKMLLVVLLSLATSHCRSKAGKAVHSRKR